MLVCMLFPAQGNDEAATAYLTAGARDGSAEHVFELSYNAALLAFKRGNMQSSFEACSRALAAYPEHTESQELMRQIKAHFTLL